MVERVEAGQPLVRGASRLVISALHAVAMAGRVRRLRYEHAEALTTRQAQRDLRDLVAAGVLESVGRTRSRYYPAGRSFPEIALEIARTPISLTSPYRT
ncbi:hypothetical protein [Nonomuraea jabiensis]|uniref:hypothetical protein n=1 Tax=Nonomuraea jabiensis TaxID=882448 RepID=UPI003D70D6BA